MVNLFFIFIIIINNNYLFTNYILIALKELHWFLSRWTGQFVM